ncbi:MAG: MFS transporter [Planctomycetota bacterium]
MASALLAASLNALSSSLTFGQPIFLLALFYGANDTVMGLLYASTSAAGLLSLLAPWMFAGQDTSVVQARAWMARAILAVGILCLPLLASDDIKIWALTIICYLMMMARTIGFLAGASVIKAICPPADLQSFSARYWGRWNAGVLITAVMCFLALQPREWGPGTEWTFMALMGFAVCFHFAAAGAIAVIPRSGTIAAASPRETLRALPIVWNRPECREVLWLTLLQAPIFLSSAFQLNYLNRVLGMPADQVFLLSLGGVLASMLSNRMLAIIGDKVSTKALWFVLHILLTVVALCWCAIESVPESGRTTVCAVLWVLASWGISGSLSVHAGMLSERLPPDDSTRISVIYQLTGVVGTVLGLLTLSVASWGFSQISGTWVHSYTHAFIFWAVLSFAISLLSLRMAGGSSPFELLAHFAPGNLVTIWRAHRFRTTETDRSPIGTMELEEVLAADTPAGRDLVLEYVRSPDIWHRRAAFRAIRGAPFGEAGPPVLAEANDAHSPLRHDAITTLGFLPFREALPLIRRLVQDPDPSIAATACKTIARLGHPEPTSTVLLRYRQATTPRERDELLIALTVANADAGLREILNEAIVARTSPSLITTIALCVAEVRGGREILCTILATGRALAADGIAEVLALVAERIGPNEAEHRRRLIDNNEVAAAAAGTDIVATNAEQLIIALALWAMTHRQPRHLPG